MLVCAVLALASQGNAQPRLGGNSLGNFRTVGHEPDINPALRRFTGIVVALGAPDAAGLVYTLRVAPIGPQTVPPMADELRGWRLTVLAGKRFASVFRVQSNTATEITVKATDGTLEATLDGVAAGDVFVIEEIDDSIPDPAQGKVAGAPRKKAGGCPPAHVQHAMTTASGRVG
jgi:hypothetical protein